MASKGQMTGMLGTYLAAAELTHRGLIVSITSRNARGADLLATDQSYSHTWSIQVKTNGKKANNWLLNSEFKELVSPTHVYLFINLREGTRPEYYVVPSDCVAACGKTAVRTTGSTWFWFTLQSAEPYREKWSIFGERRETQTELDSET